MFEHRSSMGIRRAGLTLVLLFIIGASLVVPQLRADARQETGQGENAAPRYSYSLTINGATYSSGDWTSEDLTSDDWNGAQPMQITPIHSTPVPSSDVMSEKLKMLNAAHQDRLVVLRDHVLYIIQDRKTMKAVDVQLTPIRKLGRQQGELGRQQGELGRKQGELGRKQGELGRQQGELAAEQGGRNLRAKMAELERKQGELGRQQEALGRQQGDLGRKQAELGRQQAALARVIEPRIDAILDDAFAKDLANPLLTTRTSR